MQRRQWGIFVSVVLAAGACGAPRDNDRTGGDAYGYNVPGDGGDAQVPGDGSPPAGDGMAQGVELNPGWLGGACVDSDDCTDVNIVNAECRTAGFPNGFCTQACAAPAAPGGNWTCPDTTYTGTLATMSRCIDANGTPLCATECDFAKSPTGCRPGYTCVLRQRYQQPGTIRPVCLPSEIQRWPGEPAPGFDVGAPCIDGADCNHNYCLKLQGGYCSKVMCDLAGCPAGSECFILGAAPNQIAGCLDSCTSAGQCREAERYTCDGDDVCWPLPSPPWNSAVGTNALCATWASQLHPCDTTADDFVVVSKAARNVTLCNGGTMVANYYGALGFSAIGDKEQQGDGKTPEGVFYAADKLGAGVSAYHKALLLSYPNEEDALRGLGTLIDATEKAAIDTAISTCAVPPQNTALGGEIELHGTGSSEPFDWTWGCVALENANIDAVFAALEIGDTIVVLP